MMERKLARAFHRMATGLGIANNQLAFMRFMTLTSANQQYRPIKKSFDVLRKRIERARYYEKDGVTVKDGFHGFRFNRYFCLRTSEGNGVLHVVFWGKYIPQEWLSRNWEEIHGAFKADIRACTSRRGKVDGLVGYLLTNYLTQQPIERMSYGWKWAWVGFCKSWTRVKEHYGNMKHSHGTELNPIVVHRLCSGNVTSGYFREFHNHYISHHIDAWKCILWEYPMTSRQLKLKGAKTQRWYEPELDLPVKKKVKKSAFQHIQGEVEQMLNARSALFQCVNPTWVT